MNPGIDAVRKLSTMGYRFGVSGDTLRYRYEGPGEPDLEMVQPLLSTVKQHKPDVLTYLRGPAPSERVLTCFDCQYFQPNDGPNPKQGFGGCAKRDRGRFGCATACAKIFELKKN